MPFKHGFEAKAELLRAMPRLILAKCTLPHDSNADERAYLNAETWQTRRLLSRPIAASAVTKHPAKTHSAIRHPLNSRTNAALEMQFGLR